MSFPPNPLATDYTDASPATPDAHANMHNDVNTAVNDVVTELGAGPKGVAADLTARLAAQDSTVAGSYTKLYGSGSVACPGTAAWRIVGDPNLPVEAGQWLNFWVGADNTTATFLRMNAITGAVAGLPTSFLATPGGSNAYYAWFSGGSTFPAPSALTEASLTANGNCPVIIGRIT